MLASWKEAEISCDTLRASGRNVPLKDLSEEVKPFSCHMERTEENCPAQSRLPGAGVTWCRCYLVGAVGVGDSRKRLQGRSDGVGQDEGAGGRTVLLRLRQETESSDWLRFCYSHINLCKKNKQKQK